MLKNKFEISLSFPKVGFPVAKFREISSAYFSSSDYAGFFLSTGTL